MLLCRNWNRIDKDNFSIKTKNVLENPVKVGALSRISAHDNSRKVVIRNESLIIKGLIDLSENGRLHSIQKHSNCRQSCQFQVFTFKNKYVSKSEK